MAPRVCRLRYRKGEPLGLAIYPAPTFTSFPLEIRNKIYKLLLISSESIIVYTKVSMLLDGYYPEPRERLPSLKVAAVTFGLLRVNRMISIEAAAIFYHHNVFKFCGTQQWPLEDPWNPIYSFLYTIGNRNRSYLRYLEAEISKPRVVKKDSNGMITSRVWESTWLHKVYGRDQHARIYPPMEVEYLGLRFDYISPAIEAVFRTLGSEGSKLRLLLILKFQNLPGTHRDDSGRLCWWTAEVPDHVERMRKQFTSDATGGESRVDVQWTSTFFKSEFESMAREIDDDGWDVLEVRDFSGPLRQDVRLWESRRETCVLFRRKTMG